MKNLTAAIFNNAQKHPEKAALIFGDQTMTYKEFIISVQAYRRGSRQNQLHQGQKVLILWPLSFKMLAFLTALFADRLIPVLIDPRLPRKQWKSAILNLNVDIIVSFNKFFKLKWLWWFLWRKKLYSSDGQSWGVKSLNQLYIEDNVDTAQSAIGLNAMTEDDISLISLSSGTTGAPKKIIRSFNTLYHQQIYLKKYTPPLEIDNHLAGYALSLMMGLVEGSTNIFADLNDIESVIQTLECGQITRFSGPPGFVFKTSQKLIQAKKTISSVQNVLVGGAPIPKWFVSDLKKAFPCAQVTLIYGATECEPISSGSGEVYLNSQKNGYFVGKLISELTMLERAHFTFDKEIFFEVGLCGLNVSSELLNEKGLPLHWTGDIAHKDSDGNIYLCGRSSDLIRQQIPTGYIEEQIENIDGIKRAALIEHMNQLILFIELRKNQSYNDKKIYNLFKKYDLALHQIKVLETMPVDPRHEWKIQRKNLLES